MKMEQCWRWFGPKDPVSLNDIMQAGATGIVSALHHIPNGEIWSKEEIAAHKRYIEWDDSREPSMPRPLRWRVVESLPVHENIKTAQADRDQLIENYKISLSNLAECGIRTVCYNFMPVLDWTRTDLRFPQPDGSLALKFDANAMAAFELFILKREGADFVYNDEEKERAQKAFEQMSEADIQYLTDTLIAGLPGSEEHYTLESFGAVLNTYKDISSEQLKDNLAYFLKAVVPHAESLGVELAIHPDDPPFPILGLPRIVSTESDFEDIFAMVDSPYNGFTFCSGSLGARVDNDLPSLVRNLGHRMHFIHLRNVERDSEGSFFEADHLDGDVDMYEVVKAILEEQQKRSEKGEGNPSIPMRPDHGHQMLDDLSKTTQPGYSAIGRLRGLAEIRGLEMALNRTLQD